MTDSVDEHEGVLDGLQDVVEVVLAEDLGPAALEDPWERRQRILDSWTTIILAIAAVATAWASFQASQWSGAQSDAQSASAIARAEAGRSATAATEATIIDSQMWLSWLGAVDQKQSAKAAFLERRFSDPLARAQEVWLSGVTVDGNGTPTSVPAGTPLNLRVYVVPAQVQSDHQAAVAETQLAYAGTAASTSTRFVVLALLFALVLFFASVAIKVSGPKNQVALILIALVLLLFASIRMVTLPQYLTGRPDAPPAVAKNS